MHTENKLYGTGKNAADALPKTGKRTQDIERQVTVTLKTLDSKLNC